MQVHRSIDDLPAFTNAVVTIGTFDGVHLGHKKIIDALRREAACVNGETVIITFDPHPRKVVNAAQPLHLINTLEEKIRLLENTGVDHLVIVPFTSEFAEQTADDYIENFLIGRFHPNTIIIGYDHHFGKGRTGNFGLLAQKSVAFGYRLLEIPKYLLDEIGVSSTQIRNALLNADISTANRLLGYHYFFGGKVVEGDKLGRQLGYPTANIEMDDNDKIRLAHGVFAVWVDIGGSRKKGMLSIGDRPTLASSDTKIEVNIFDFNGMIYGRRIEVTVVAFLRGQEKYNSLTEMQVQLAKDKLESLRVL